VQGEHFQYFKSSKSTSPPSQLPQYALVFLTRSRIVDDDGKVLTEEGATGDIFVKSPFMMLGYINNEKATNEAFDNDGWLNTGDVGQLTEGNKVFIVDRKKDLMKVRGWQVSPAEIESVIMQHPHVIDAAVVGIPLANHTGELPRAYVVVRPGNKVSERDLKAFLSKDLARYKMPEEFVFIDRIPKNGTGKILRRLLREQAATETKPEPCTLVLAESTTRSSWRHLRSVSMQASHIPKSIYGFFTWLRSLIL
jgi:acyl-CoA synthetase (AMP-forming)/AMP-acid ligase II